MKPLVFAAGIVIVAIPIFFIFSCGGSGLPAEAACPTPAALTTNGQFGDSATADQRALAAYDQAIRAGILQLQNLRRSFSAQYPTDAFFRESSFRPDFARYADQSVCTAQQILATQPPAVDGQATHIDNPTLHSALNTFIAAMHDGRNAIAHRNVTEYRKWYAGIQAKLDAINEAFTNPSGQTVAGS